MNMEGRHIFFVALTLCFSVVVLLEDEPPPNSQLFCSLHQVLFQDSPAFTSIHLPMNSDKLICPPVKE